MAALPPDAWGYGALRYGRVKTMLAPRWPTASREYPSIRFPFSVT
jgi:hypothetical protein